MAETWFTPKEWKARLVEFAGRRLLRNVANGQSATYDVSRSEGQVSQEGDAFNTKNMNDLERRISNGFANAKTNVDALSRDFAGGQMEIRLTEAGKGEYRKKGADTWFPFSSISSLKMIFETGYNFSTMGNPNVLTFSAPETGTFFLLIHVSGRTNDSRHDHNFGSMEISGCDATQIFHTFKNTHQTGTYPYAGATVIRGYIVKLTKDVAITITSTLSTPFNYADAILFEL